MGEGILVKIKEFLDCLLEILFPEECSCALCGRILKKYDKFYLCEHCRSNLVYLKDPIIDLNALINNVNYKNMEVSLSQPIFSIFLYEGLSREMVHKLKYNGRTEIASSMAAYIKEELIKNRLKIDFIVPVPSHVKRIRQRGYSQAGLIALKLAEMMEIPCIDLLCKIKDTKSQVLFNGEDRWYNVKDAFALNEDIDWQRLKGQRVLLLDDIITTGATVYYCSSELKKNGIEQITAVSFART